MRENKEITREDARRLRALNKIPHLACWCCGMAWVANSAGQWRVNCHCAHWSMEKYRDKYIMCEKCRDCHECCKCKGNGK